MNTIIAILISLTPIGVAAEGADDIAGTVTEVEQETILELYDPENGK